MILLCLTLAATLVVNTPVEIDERTVLLQPYIKSGECIAVPHETFVPNVRNLHIVEELNEMYIISGNNSGIEFWSWTEKAGEFGKHLAKKRDGA